MRGAGEGEAGPRRPAPCPRDTVRPPAGHPEFRPRDPHPSDTSGQHLGTAPGPLPLTAPERTARRQPNGTGPAVRERRPPARDERTRTGGQTEAGNRADSRQPGGQRRSRASALGGRRRSPARGESRRRGECVGTRLGVLARAHDIRRAPEGRVRFPGTELPGFEGLFPRPRRLKRRYTAMFARSFATGRTRSAAPSARPDRSCHAAASKPVSRASFFSSSSACFSI